MKISQLAKTLGLGAGSLITHSGMSIFGITALLDYLEITDPYLRTTTQLVAALSTATIVSSTRLATLWQYFSKTDSSDTVLENQNRQVNTNHSKYFTIAIKTIIIANIAPIYIFSGYLSTSALLNFIGIYNGVIIIIASIYAITSDLATFFTFVFKKAIENFQVSLDLLNDYRRNNQTLSQKSALKAILLCIANTITQSMLVNFFVKNALEVFPGLNQIESPLFAEIVAGIFAVFYLPLSFMIAEIQAYRFFEKQDRHIFLPNRLSLGNKLAYASFFFLAATYLIFDGGKSYISCVDLFGQIGIPNKNIVIQLIATLLSLSMAFSDYVFTIRSGETNVIQWIHSYLSYQELRNPLSTNAWSSTRRNSIPTFFSTLTKSYTNSHTPLQNEELLEMQTLSTSKL